MMCVRLIQLYDNMTIMQQLYDNDQEATKQVLPFQEKFGLFESS